MRGSQLLSLLTQLRNDVGRSSDVSVGVADLEELKQRLNVSYEFLYNDYDWPHLRRFSSRLQMNASQRYYDVPATLDYEGIERAVVWYNGRPIEITRGIRHEDYFSFSSEDGETSAPILKWDVRFTDPREQLEFWPMPSAGDQEIEFVGKRKFTRLVNESDVCLLDDNMVVLRAAAEILSRQGSKDASTRLQEAQQVYGTIRRRTQGGARTRHVGQGAPGLTQKGGPPHFYVTVR